MENSTLQLEKKSVAEYLLNETDFEVIRSGNHNYLFLADSLRFFRITNPKIEEYLRLCVTKNSTNTSLLNEEIICLGNNLKENEKQESERAPVFDCNFLILNITAGCNLACKYCFAETDKDKKSMPLETAQKAINNMLSQKNEINEYSIYYFGGEPLFKKKLLRQITEYAYQETEAIHV